MSTPPETTEGILATGIMAPEFEAAWKARGSPAGDMPADVSTLKRIVDASLGDLQQKLGASRPPNINESEHVLPLSTGFGSRLLVCHPHPLTKPSPVILLFHGGIHVLGHPEFDLPLARSLALAHNATVLCPSTRKAPEHPFPAMLHDAWAILQVVAHEASLPTTERFFLPPHADAGAGFIVGGTSSGANFADVVVHLARDKGMTPAVTGQVLVCGAFLDPGHVPEAHRGRYLSREQNRGAPVANERFLKAFTEAIRPDVHSLLWAPFGQSHEGMPPVYFQVCGMDLNRDDGLIYERVLREGGVATRLDLYAGFPHCWWDMYPELEASDKRMEDTIGGVGWLLGLPTPEPNKS
jgi:acetyl esterase/lipase